MVFSQEDTSWSAGFLSIEEDLLLATLFPKPHVRDLGLLITGICSSHTSVFILQSPTPEL